MEYTKDRRRLRYRVLESINIVGVAQNRIGPAFWNAWADTASDWPCCIAPLLGPVEYEGGLHPPFRDFRSSKKCQIRQMMPLALDSQSD
jgi:hypothetical protein